MLIDSLYNSISQNLLSVFGSNINASEQEATKNQSNIEKNTATNQTTISGDKISISAEARALYAKQQVESTQEQSYEQNTNGQAGSDQANLSDYTSSITGQIQALQGQLASLTSQVSADDPVSLGQIEQLKMQISVLQSQLNA